MFPMVIENLYPSLFCSPQWVGTTRIRSPICYVGLDWIGVQLPFLLISNCWLVWLHFFVAYYGEFRIYLVVSLATHDQVKMQTVFCFDISTICNQPAKAK